MLTGFSFIGARRAASANTATFSAKNPATGETLEPVYHSATAEETEEAARLAHEAFPVYSRATGERKGAFLRAIAANIEALGNTLTERVRAESGLPEARVKGETARTCGQLRLFASLVEDGAWVDARVDRADPARRPIPKPDTRSMLRPRGPVAVFGAANFPLAFSTAGGDTASALAAGCPVIVKAHPSHPGASELVAGAILAAARETGMPEGVFSLLYDAGHDVGKALASHPFIKAIGFTGSRAGGRALMALAAAREEPIPVFAEMSSVNPVFLLPGALAERGEQIAAGLAASVLLGTGQFCTNPGLVVYDRNADAAGFKNELRRLLAAAPPATMLSESIRRNYETTRARLAAHPAVTELARVPETPGAVCGGAALYETTASAVLADRALTEEVFGPCTLLVAADGPGEALALAKALEGQLTATLHGTAADFAEHAELAATLERLAGRVLFNGFPTGVEVNHSMVHGGPFPATSDGGSTSVGTAAILRFTRRVCWQDCPDSLLPPELQEANPPGIPRLEDGKRV